MVPGGHSRFFYSTSIDAVAADKRIVLHAARSIHTGQYNISRSEITATVHVWRHLSRLIWLSSALIDEDRIRLMRLIVYRGRSSLQCIAVVHQCSLPTRQRVFTDII